MFIEHSYLINTIPLKIWHKRFLYCADFHSSHVDEFSAPHVGMADSAGKDGGN